MGKNISIVDVARHAGVSVSTVSLVMNNRPNVAPDTASAVWESVKELGYEPGGDGKKRGPKPGPRKNRQFSAMGILMTGQPGGLLWSSNYLRALQGIQSSLSEKRLNLALYQAENSSEAREIVRRNQLDAVILFGEATEEKLVQSLRRQVCVQVYGRSSGEGYWDLVSFDNGAAGRLGAQHLLGRGHEELVFIGTDSAVSVERGAVFSREVSLASKRVTVINEANLVSFSDSVAEVNHGELLALVRSLSSAEGGMPSGVFLCCDLLAASLHSVLYEVGLLPAGHFDLVCCNGLFPHLVGTYPRPAVIDVHGEQVGRQAVDQALWRREHRNEPHVVRLVSPALLPSPSAD